MGLFSRREPQPKDEPEEVSAVDESLARLNEIDTELTHQLRQSKGRPTHSIVILKDQSNQELRKLIHEQGVVPTLPDQKGKWKLFG